MKNTFIKLLFSLFFINFSFFFITKSHAQYGDKNVIEAIINEATNNSQLERLGMELMDDIGPRLIGSPQMKQAQNWLIENYNSWGIEAKNEKYGQWKSWERGTTSAFMLSPRKVQLNATQLAWCPNGTVEAEVIIMPSEFKDSMAFVHWVKNVKGKIVLISKIEYSGRPESNWKEFATSEDFENYQKIKAEWNKKWNDNMTRIGQNARTLPKILEENGAVGLISCNLTAGWNAYRIMAARTEKAVHINLTYEDYSLLYRLAERGKAPKIKIEAKSRHLGMTDVHNTIAKHYGNTSKDEYILLSAHFDSWDGGTGATDNATGTLLMMEVMRILKKVYPEPKRKIIVGHWGGEEQGINGSAGFVEDHKDIWDKISVVFNQDNGTGRINWINGNGFLDAYDYFGRWMKYLPQENSKHIKTNFPGDPGGRASSDYYSFMAVGIPAFFLISESWDYSNYTWHTSLDTYDKVVWEEMRKNVITIAILTYLACEEPEMFSRRKAELPFNIEKGTRNEWPKPLTPNRDGKY